MSNRHRIEKTTIYLRGATWWIYYRWRGEQVRYSLETKNEDVARQLQIQTEADLIRGLLGLPEQIGLRDAITEFLVQHADRKHKTRQKNKGKLGIFRRWVNEHSGLATDPMLDEIDQNVLVDYKVHRSGKVAGGTVAGDLQVLSAFFRWATEQGYLQKSPVTRNVRRVMQQQEAHRLALTAKEREIYEDKLRGTRLWPVYLVGVYAGLRRAEIAQLAFDDIRDGRISVHAKPKIGFTPKTCQQRTVPIESALSSYLQTSASASGRRQAMASQNPAKTGPVCPSPRGLHWCVDNLTHAWIDTTRNLELPPERERGFGCTIHELRHTYASIQLIEEGVDIYTLMRRMGHRDIGTTQVYLHLFGS